MNRRLLGMLVAASLMAACETEQPPIGCPVQSLTWAVTYKPKGPSSCPVKAGEQLGIQKFSTPTGEEQLSIKPATLVALDERDPERLAYSIGALAKEADAEGFCSATVGTAEKQAPATADLPATSITYAWSNVRILALPLAPGTQMVADLTYTEDGCTAEYEVWGMWPGDVDCANEAGEPDNGICANAGGINPDFSTVCDPTQLRCVPAKRPPSLR
ncbi:hypothetical protein [Hyalangium minutum]|uniref:Putative lipoprotein MlpA n=1 Tax=Hyalangium minutum TaxID=394096 RepID=A0A085WGJ9_9BACT|nr:hypothetical protein [Hyalangium minutum]KFE66812.1 putative lipoprotein MlpA [Hyalangium minutum]